MSVKKQLNNPIRVKHNKNQVKVSTFAIKVLKRLHLKVEKPCCSEGGLTLGHLNVPPSLINELCTKGLLIKKKDGVLVTTDTAASFLRRHSNNNETQSFGMIGASPSNIFQKQHATQEQVVRLIEGKLQRLNVNAAESPLGWLKFRKDKNGKKLISDRQFEALERLRFDYETSQMAQQITARYDGVPISKTRRGAVQGLNFTEQQMASKKRYDDAVQAVGAGLSDSLIRVVCNLEGFEAAEKSLGWPSRSMKLVITMALERLVSHYYTTQWGERSAQ